MGEAVALVSLANQSSHRAPVPTPTIRVSPKQQLPSAVASANAESLRGENRPLAANSTLTSKADASQSPAALLWKEAFDELSESDKESLPFADDDKRNYLENVLDQAARSRDTCRARGLKFKFGEKTFVVRDLADKILSWVKKFKEIGDIAVQYDPGHAALPWAGIRLVLQACLPFIKRQAVSADCRLVSVD